MSGYLAATLAQKGDDVPVAILNVDAPENPIARSAADAAPTQASSRLTVRVKRPGLNMFLDWAQTEGWTAPMPHWPDYWATGM